MPAVSDSLSLIYFQTKQSNSDSRLFFRQEKFSPVSVMNRSMKNAEILFKTVIILCVNLFVFTVKKIFLSPTKNSTAQHLMQENLQRVFLQKILSCITPRTKHFKHAKEHILQRQEQFLTEIYLFPMILKLLT